MAGASTPTVSGGRLATLPAAEQQLIAAIAAVPPGVKLSIPALRDALVSQADVLDALKRLVDAGRLDRASLRPPQRAVKARLVAVEVSDPGLSAERHLTGTELADRLAEHCIAHRLSLGRALRYLRVASCAQLRQHQPRPKTVARFMAFFEAPPASELAARRAGGARVAAVDGVTGAELAAKLEAMIAEHGLSRSRVALRVNGNRSVLAVLRRSNPRRATVERILALLADPPIDDLKPRDAWGGRRAKKREVVEVIEPGGCAPPVLVQRKSGQKALIVPGPSSPTSGRTFEEQLARVERGEVGIAPNLKIGRPDPAGTLGGVTGEINL